MTDKAGFHSYLDFYRELFRGRAVLNILEIGIADGSSLELWSEMFPHATVWGIDIRPAPKRELVNADRIRMLQSDVGDVDRVGPWIGETRFDIVIDDGSHILADQLYVFDTFRSRLVPGGLLVIEDYQASYYGFEPINALVPRPIVIDRRLVTGLPDEVLLIHQEPML